MRTVYAYIDIDMVIVLWFLHCFVSCSIYVYNCVTARSHGHHSLVLSPTIRLLYTLLYVAVRCGRCFYTFTTHSLSADASSHSACACGGGAKRRYCYFLSIKVYTHARAIIHTGVPASIYLYHTYTGISFHPLAHTHLYTHTRALTRSHNQSASLSYKRTQTLSFRHHNAIFGER